MGYAVDYIPTSEQKRRKVKKKYRREHVTSKAIRAKDMKKAVKWNLPKLEYDTTGGYRGSFHRHQDSPLGLHQP